MIRFLLILLFSAVHVILVAQPLTRIAFGSCSEETNSEQMWTDVLTTQPQLWIWLGDIIYADSQPEGKPKGSMRELYAQQKAHPGYQKLLKNATITGVWDDHDYGVNDGGKFYAHKKESKEALLEFLDTPPQDPVRSHEGVYSAHTYGQGKQKVKVILLDTRYFRDTLYASGKPGIRYEINPQGDVLGEEQWSWLERELTNSDAAIHIIGTGTQFIANDHGFEKWGNFPRARQRMIELLSRTKPNNTLFISGDRHIAEVSKMKIPGWKNELYDFTSSGLTHTWTTPWEEPNQYRVGELIIQKNFGLIEIDWRKSKIIFKVMGYHQSTYATHTLPFGKVKK